MELATRNAQEIARARARPLAGRRGPDAGAPSRSSPTRSACPVPPARIECYDISNFQGAQSVGSMVVFEEGRPRTGEYRRFRIRTVAGPQRLREPPGGAAPAVPARQGGRGGERGGAPLGDARPRDHRRRQGPGQRRQGGPRRAGPARPAARGPRQGARGAGPARPHRPGPAARRPHRRCTSSSGSATRPTGSRSRTTATCAQADGPRRRSTTCPGVGPKRRRALLQVFGSVKRVREAPVEQIAAVPGIGPALARADQGPPRGLTRPTGASSQLHRASARRCRMVRAVPCIIPPRAQSRPHPDPRHRPRSPSWSTSCPGLSARSGDRPASPRSSRRSSGSTCRAACGSSTRCCPTGRQGRPTPADLERHAQIIDRRA